MFVASSAPLDQFIVQHPEYFFGSSPEQAHIQPDNLEILVNHLKCAVFELPLSPDERFGNVDLPELCEQLGEVGFLQRSGGNWHWVQEGYPAATYRRTKARFEHRLLRLERKVGRTLIDALDT